jgi:uroporphyrinogen-III decarboxylase
MNSRERLDATINHQTPDRLCVDFGAGGQTGIGVVAVHKLRQKLFGESDFKVKVIEPYQMLGEVDMELIRSLELDVAGVPAPATMFGFRCQDWKPFTMTEGIEVLVPGKFNYTRDDQGAIYIYPDGDIKVPPSAKMPHGGYFFDALDRQQPLSEETLNPEDNLEEFGIISGNDLVYYEEVTKKLSEETDLGIYVTLPGTAFGDIALVPATWMKNPKGIRGVEEWYISLLTREDYIHKIFEKQCEIALKNIELLAGALGDRAQVVFLSGTDFGTQTGLFNSLESYRNLFQPYQKALNDKIHQLTNWKTFIHSCGAIYDLIPDLIDAGFDILNPVQISANGMDAKKLKTEFGKDIVFWGGGIDTQHTLPFGTPDEVYREVRKNIEIFADGGGYVFNAVHNVQSNVPLENILAMFDALNDARGINQHYR